MIQFSFESINHLIDDVVFFFCVIFLKQRILDDFSKAILLRRTIKEAHSPKI